MTTAPETITGSQETTTPTPDTSTTEPQPASTFAGPIWLSVASIVSLILIKRRKEGKNQT